MMSRRALAITFSLIFTFGLFAGYQLRQVAPLQIGRWLRGNSAEIANIPGVNENNYPRVNGSTSTLEMGQLLAARAVGLRGELRRTALRYGWEPSSMLTFPLDADAKRLEVFGRLQSRLHHSGTHESYVSLMQSPRMPDAIDRREMEKLRLRNDGPVAIFSRPRGYRPADVILVARKPSADELKLAKEKKIELDIRPVALDAFVFMANTDNPVHSLTLSHIRDIYTGKITNWQAVAGRDESIEAFTRNRNSGSEELMNELVMQGRKIIEGDDVISLSTMIGPIERISSTPNAIAYSVYYYEHIMNPRPMNRLLGVNGILPTSPTIANRTYPLVAEVYVVTRKGLKLDSPAVKLRDWLLSDEGQKLVAASGYVPIHPVK
ncbi:MAG: PstS family phosphate ABC transporter substrate-binding protein [Armatimonadota bacterium]